MADAPVYPIACPRCEVMYGPGGEVGSHRPGSVNCMERRAVLDAQALEILRARDRAAKVMAAVDAG